MQGFQGLCLLGLGAQQGLEVAPGPSLGLEVAELLKAGLEGLVDQVLKLQAAHHMADLLADDAGIALQLFHQALHPEVAVFEGLHQLLRLGLGGHGHGHVLAGDGLGVGIRAFQR